MGWPGATREMMGPRGTADELVGTSSSSSSEKTEQTAQLAPAPRRIWRGIRKGIECVGFSRQFLRQGKRLEKKSKILSNIAPIIADRDLSTMRGATGTVYTWRNYSQESARFACSLLKLGLPPRTCVYIVAPNKPQWHIAYVGAVRTHHPLLPHLVKCSGFGVLCQKR